MQDLPEPSPADAKPKSPCSTLISRNITVADHRTSVRLEPEMWQGLTEVCRRERASIHEVCTAIAHYKTKSTSLTAAIRVFIMTYFRTAATEEGHTRAGHGQKLTHVTVPSVMHAILSAPAQSTRSGLAGGTDQIMSLKAMPY